MNKHLKRLILVALTLTLALSCLPMFSAFAAEDDPAEEIIVPAVLTIGSEKTLFEIDEAIPFEISGIGEKEELWITAPGEKKASLHTDNLKDGTHKIAFSVSGEYKAYIVTWQGEESTQSAEISFYVGLPTVATLTAAQTTCNIGGSITFMTQSNGTECALLLYTGDSDEAETIAVEDNSVTLTFDAEGTYRVQLKTTNANGECLSEEITVTVVSGLSIPNPGKNENPVTTTAQVPQPADYTRFIVPGIILAIILIIVLIVVVKINKKKKRAQAAQQ